MHMLHVRDFDQIWGIMEEAFPSDERRSYEGQKALFLRDDYHVCGTVEKGVVKAFIAYYDTKNFCFVEHLASDARKRGSGIGKALFLDTLVHVGKPVILEVEPPITDIAKRRIAFYERMGCYLHDEIGYQQPPLEKQLMPLPLRLMSVGKNYDERQLKNVVTVLYQSVYRIDGCIDK